MVICVLVFNKRCSLVMVVLLLFDRMMCWLVMFRKIGKCCMVLFFELVEVNIGYFFIFCLLCVVNKDVCLLCGLKWVICFKLLEKMEWCFVLIRWIRKFLKSCSVMCCSFWMILYVMLGYLRCWFGIEFVN